MPTRHVNLTEALDAFVEQAVASGRYGDASEVVRDALRRLETGIAAESARLAALEAAIDEGLADHDAGRFIELGADEIGPWVQSVVGTGHQR